MHTIVTALTQTPWWVYLLLVILVRRGIAAGRPSVVPLWKLTIMPVIFLAMDISGMANDSQLSARLVVIWLLCLACGGVVASLLVRNLAVRADRAAWRIRLPGDPAVLPLVLVTFAIKYAMGYLQASSHTMAASGGFLTISFVVSGFFTGIFLGRFCAYLVKFFAAPAEALAPAPPG